MVKHVNYKNNISLSELEWAPGEPIAFDCRDIDTPHPFVLAVPNSLIRGFNDSKKGFKLLFVTKEGKREGWTLQFRGDALGLWSPTYKGSQKLPYFETIKQGFLHTYFVEDMYSGRESIQNALSGVGLGFDFYAECLKESRLIIERSKIEKIAEKLGLGFILPSQLRFQY